MNPEINQQLFESELGKLSRGKKVLRSVFPKMVERSIQRKLKDEALADEERRRREELGPKGRIREDALSAVNATMTTSNRKQDRKLFIGGHRRPLGNYPHSWMSYLENTDIYVDKTDSQRQNFLGPNFAFAVAINENYEAVQDQEGKTEAFLVGAQDSEAGGWDIIKDFKLDDAFLDSLSREDLDLLEKMAAHSLAKSRRLAFIHNADRFI